MDRFASQRGTIRGSNGPILDRSILRAFGLWQSRFPEAGRIESHFGSIFATAARERRWVIVFTHDVSDHPGPYGCTPRQLHKVVSLAREHGLDVATNSEVMRRLQSYRGSRQECAVTRQVSPKM
jgi:hypothetical protein